MARPQRFIRAFAVALALLTYLALPGLARAQGGSLGTEIYQCRNRLDGPGSNVNNCTGSAWVHGNAGHSNSFYREGDYVPMRAIITSLEAGHTYTLRLGYDAVQGGLHAYDYLGSVDGSIHPGQVIAPCINSPPTSGTHACGHNPSLLEVPKDTHTHFPPLLGGSQEDGDFSAWGGTLEHAAYHYCTVAESASHACGPIGLPGQASYVPREIDVRFEAAGNTVLLAWGAHIASVLDWGVGRTFINAGSGSSFHMRLRQIQAQGRPPESTGGQELSLSASALAPQPPSFVTNVAPPSITTDGSVVDTATLTGLSSRPVTGSVAFFVCGPNESGPPACSVDGEPVGPSQVLNTGGEASIEFPRPGEGPILPGHYCFRAEYSPGPGSLYSPATHAGGPTVTAECFHVTLPLPRLTVTKVCDPLDDPGLFDLLLTPAGGNPAPIPGGTDVPCTNPPQSRGPFELDPGTYTVSESAGTGTNLADYVQPPTFSGNCAPAGVVMLALNDSKTCTITNVRLGEPTGFLTVQKICTTAGDTGRFEIHLNGTKVAELECSQTTEPIELAPGNYTVTEQAGEDTSLADYEPPVFGTHCPGGAVTIVANETTACTITNTRIPPTTTLEVRKLCDPTGDRGRFKLTIDKVTGERVHRVVVRCGGTTGAVTVAPGDYVVGERGANGTHLAKYDRFIGGDCESDGSITIEGGEEPVCTILNVRRQTEPRPALLTVTKICVPADDGGRFTLTIVGQTSREVACGQSLGPIAVPPGQHQVGESAGAGASLSAYTTTIGGACAANGTITLAAGEEETCTITNERAGEQTGTVEVVKQCSPAGTSSHFQLEIGEYVFRGIACGHSTGTVVIGVGSHRVGEVAVTGTTSRFATTIGGGCAPNGSFTLSAGQHVVCVVTNTLVPVEPPLKPPAACYTLTVKPRRAIAGKPLRVVARVHIDGRGAAGIRVYLTGPGVSTVRTTGRTGRALFVLTPTRSGVLRVTIRRQYLCPVQPPHVIGIGGVAFTG